MSNVSYVFAFIAGTFLASVLYGVFLALLIAACYVQWDKYSKGQGVNWVMVFTTVFFGSTITTDCIIMIYRSIQAVFYLPDGVTAYEYLGPPYPTLEVFRMALYQLQILVGDIILAHRMYHIYDRNLFMCIVPSISITGLFVVGCGITNQLRNVTTPRREQVLIYWSSACFCLTIFNSLFMTISISFKLWCVHSETARANIRVRGSVVLRAMKVLIESAALWTAFVGMCFLAFLAKSNLMYTFLAMTGPAVGISFCLIIVRLGRVLPESQEESWHMSIQTPSTQTPATDEICGSFAHGIFTGRSKSEFSLETESQKQAYVEYGLGDPPGIPIRASLNLPAS